MPIPIPVCILYLDLSDFEDFWIDLPDFQRFTDASLSKPLLHPDLSDFEDF